MKLQYLVLASIFYCHVCPRWLEDKIGTFVRGNSSMRIFVDETANMWCAVFRCKPKCACFLSQHYNRLHTIRKPQQNMDKTKVLPKKKCKIAKYDKNHAAHYSLIIQSFTPESTSSVHPKNLFNFVMETTHLAKEDEPSFAKHYETFSTLYSWYVPILLVRPGFIVVCE